MKSVTMYEADDGSYHSTAGSPVSAELVEPGAVPGHVVVRIPVDVAGRVARACFNAGIAVAPDEAALLRAVGETIIASLERGP